VVESGIRGVQELKRKGGGGINNDGTTGKTVMAKIENDHTDYIVFA